MQVPVASGHSAVTNFGLGQSTKRQVDSRQPAMPSCDLGSGSTKRDLGFQSAKCLSECTAVGARGTGDWGVLRWHTSQRVRTVKIAHGLSLGLHFCSATHSGKRGQWSLTQMIAQQEEITDTSPPSTKALWNPVPVLLFQEEGQCATPEVILSANFISSEFFLAPPSCKN